MHNLTTHASASVCVSFEQIYREHAAYVHRSVARRGVPHAAVPDVAQEVFTAVYLNLAAFSGDSPIKHWISGITRNIVNMFFRRRENQLSTVLFDDDTDTLIEPEGPDASLERKAYMELLSGALERMTEPQRQTFWLYELEEMPGSEVAKTLGVSENTVRMRMRAARKQLSSWLEEQEPNEGEREREDESRVEGRKACA